MIKKKVIFQDTAQATPPVPTAPQSPVSSNELKQLQADADKAVIKATLQNRRALNKKIEELAGQSHEVIFSAKTVFPFDLFPDQITIDLNKVNIVTKHFFFTGRIHSVFIKNVSDVFVEAVPFFATLRIVDISFVDNTVDVHFLWKQDAYRARRIIQGLVVVRKEGVDLTNVPRNDLPQKIEEIGLAKEMIL